MKEKYKPRPIRFLEIIEHDDWKIKLYSISYKAEIVNSETIQLAKSNLGKWLGKTDLYTFENYRVATLILHEWNGGSFAVINWWIDENMLQHFVYLANNEKPDEFNLYSDKGIITCVWELAVLSFERDAWVEHVLKRGGGSESINNYLQHHFNSNV